MTKKEADKIAWLCRKHNITWRLNKVQGPTPDYLIKLDLPLYGVTAAEAAKVKSGILKSYSEAKTAILTYIEIRSTKKINHKEDPNDSRWPEWE